MNPNREHISDGSAVDADLEAEPDAASEFKTWLTAPPRGRRRDVVRAALLGGFAIVWFAVSLARPNPAGPAGAAIVLSGSVWAIAEVLPAHAVRAATWMRIAGTVCIVAAMVSMFVFTALHAT